VQPTIWTGLPESSAIVREEIFGPCCHIAPFDTRDEAVALANDTEYGLATTVWTQNLSPRTAWRARSRWACAGSTAGSCATCAPPSAAASRAGIGREGGVHSLEFYTELRNVMVKL
jgi:aminomuconate-semialdehyde/2-hydroxymuconate-6-semialdehyde dehydrogenase